MDEAEFDKFAEEYKRIHAGNIRASGESPEFFAEYKVKESAKLVHQHDFPDELSILDFGAGTGVSVPFFRRYLPQAKLTCLDVSRKSLAIGAKRFSSEAEFDHFDGRRIPVSDDAFHLVFAACVFHHIPHELHDCLLIEIFRVLKSGGILIIFEHNPNNPLTVHAVNTCPFDENAVLIRGSKFRELVQRAGFINDRLCYRIFFPAPLSFLRPVERFLTWLPLGAQYYVCAQKPA